MADSLVFSPHEVVDVRQHRPLMQQEFDLAPGLKLKKEKKHPNPKDMLQRINDPIGIPSIWKLGNLHGQGGKKNVFGFYE